MLSKSSLGLGVVSRDANAYSCGFGMTVLDTFAYGISQGTKPYRPFSGKHSVNCARVACAATLVKYCHEDV